MSRTDIILYVMAIAVVVIAIAIYYSINPEGIWWFPKCTLYKYTGLKCPLCGLQRAIHQLLHLNILAAFRYNYFLPISAVYWGIVLIITRKNLSRIFYFYCLLAVLWAVVRNVFGF